MKQNQKTPTPIRRVVANKRGEIHSIRNQSPATHAALIANHPNVIHTQAASNIPVIHAGNVK
jgi:hypothetical protein